MKNWWQWCLATWFVVSVVACIILGKFVLVRSGPISLALVSGMIGLYGPLFVVIVMTARQHE